MTAYRLAITLALTGPLVPALSPTAAAQTYECREVKIPTRDGVNLAADVYVPRQGNGPFPVAVHSYHLERPVVKALRRRGVLVSRHLEAKLFAALARRLAARTRVAV